MPNFTATRTWTTGEVVTAAMLNEQIRDNEGFLWAPPRCRVYKSANQVISHDTVTVVSFDSEQYDNDGMHSTSTNNSRITPTRAGYYRFVGILSWDFVAASYRESYLRLNGTTNIVPARDNPVQNTPVGTTQVLEIDLQMNGTTDYVEITVKHQRGSGQTIDLLSGFDDTMLMATWIGG